MAARKTTKKAPAAAKQPEASKPAEKPAEPKAADTSKQSPGTTGAAPSQPVTGEGAQSSGDGEAAKDSTNPPSNGEESVKAPAAPETKPEKGDDESTERGPAKDGNPSDNPEESAGKVKLEVFTRLDRRIRGGVTVTNEKRIVSVTEDVAARIEADPHIATVRVTE